MKYLLLTAFLGTVLCLTVPSAAFAAESAGTTEAAESAGTTEAAESAGTTEEEGKYIEEIIVTSERGDINVLDRAMTVTGFNEQMIENLGIQNAGDLEALVAGLQVGNRTQGGGKGEDDHFYMRGIGSERAVNFFSDTSVAVYVDGVYTDQTYGTDGFFDVERVEVARGPQGTTGGRAALSGSISFLTKKPTDTFDVTAIAEVTDQVTQKYQVAFGGPIADTGLSYRLKLSSLTGDGQIRNVGPGPDAGEPDQTIWAPQLRWRNDRWDILARYTNQTDKGTPDVSIPLGAVDTEHQFNAVAGVFPTTPDDPSCPEIMENGVPTGMHRCATNPYFGTAGIPSTRNCSNVNQDGTVDPNAPGYDAICDPDELEHIVSLDAPLNRDNSAESAGVDVTFNVTDSLVMNYKFGWREVIQDNFNDSDKTGRTGGGVCLPTHTKAQDPVTLGAWEQDAGGIWFQPETPAVDVNGDPIFALLTPGQTSPYCAMDGGGNGVFSSTVSNVNFTSEQISHELSLVSNFEGRFNFTVGLTYIDGEEPYDYRSFNLHGAGSNEWMYTDTSAVCEANIEALYGPGGSLSVGGQNQLLRNLRTSDEAMALAPVYGLMACPGSAELLHISGTDQANYTANMNGQVGNFMGDSEYTSEGAYLNLEYTLNDSWQFFGGVRRDVDEKSRATTGVAASSSWSFARVTEDPSEACTGVESRDCFGVVGLIMRDGTIDGFEAKKGTEWKANTWNVGVEFTPNESMMVYGRISTGSRPGGFYGWATVRAPWSWEAEEMTNYELGVKGLYFDNKLQMEATVFHQDFDNHWLYASRSKTPEEQATDPFSSPITSEVTGISGTTIQGIELQGAWQIMDTLTLRGFYNYLDASVGDYNSLYPYIIPGAPEAPWGQANYTDAQGNAIVGGWYRDQNIEFGGHQLANQAEHKGSLTLAYDAPVPASLGTLEVLTMFSYTGQKFVELGNIDAYSIEPFKRWDLRFNWRSPSQTISATLYVQNLLDQTGIQNWSPREGIGGWGTVVEPREYGLIFTYRN